MPTHCSLIVNGLEAQTKSNKDMRTALEILNQVEPNGELLDTDKAIEAMELYADQFRQPEVSGSLPPLSEEEKVKIQNDFRKKFSEKIWKTNYFFDMTPSER